MIAAIYARKSTDQNVADEEGERSTMSLDESTGKPRHLTDYCILARRSSEDLHACMAGGRTDEFEENKPWSTGQKLLARARAEGKAMPILFAPAEVAGGPIYYGFLESIDITPGPEPNKKRGAVTKYRFTGLTPVESQPGRGSIALFDERRPLSDQFIRSYALCVTPDFVAG